MMPFRSLARPAVTVTALTVAALTATLCLGAATTAVAASGASAPSGASPRAVHQQTTALLRPGSRGLAVREWQSLLNRAFTGGTVDHPVLTVDGVYGPSTASGTRAVQAAARISQDGVVGPATRSALPGLLPGAVSTVPDATGPLLRVGSLGGDVVDWQRTIGGLAGSGRVVTPPPAQDGVFGPATRAGTIAVQRVLRVSQDGVVGPRTRAGAERLLAEAAGR